MLLQDAIRSKKPFKLSYMKDYLYVKTDPTSGIEFFFWATDHTRCGVFTVMAVLSEEWLLMEIPDNLIKFPVKPIPQNRPPEAS